MIAFALYFKELGDARLTSLQSNSQRFSKNMSNVREIILAESDSILQAVQEVWLC